MISRLLFTVALLCCVVRCQTLPQGCTLAADGQTYTCPVVKQQASPQVGPAPSAPASPPATSLPSQAVQTPSLPTSWMGAGAAWNPASRPQVAGWASYAKLLSQSAQIYSFTSWDVTSSAKVKWNAQTSTRTGFAVVMKNIGPFYLLGLGDAGAATNTSMFGGAFSGGGVGLIRIPKSLWTVEFAVRVLKVAGQTSREVYEFGVGHVASE